MANTIEFKDSWRASNITYTYVHVNGVEVGFYTQDHKLKEFKFFFDDGQRAYDEPKFNTKKELIVHLNDLLLPNN